MSPPGKTSGEKESIFKRRPKESQSAQLENDPVEEDPVLNEEESLAAAEMSHEEASPPVIKLETPSSPENGNFFSLQTRGFMCRGETLWNLRWE